jgi:ubiquinone/menaquinone biosynthesis C-methylase UbiE
VDDDSVQRNRAAWNEAAPAWADAGRRHWSTDEISWGEMSVPEDEVRVLPDVAGRDVVELGCGTGYISAWLHRRGARLVGGVDPTEGQLATARVLQAEIGPRFPLVQASGEQVPLRDASFDLVVSEYGAAIWADPYQWIPEAARLLRPGGELVFLGNSVLFVLCAPDAEEPAGASLQRDQRGLHRVTYSDTPAVEFHISHGDRIRLLRRSGFEVLDLVELYAEVGAPDPTVPGADGDVTYLTSAWASRWPGEEIWRARKR